MSSFSHSLSHPPTYSPTPTARGSLDDETHQNIGMQLSRRNSSQSLNSQDSDHTDATSDSHGTHTSKRSQLSQGSQQKEGRSIKTPDKFSDIKSRKLRAKERERERNRKVEVFLWINGNRANTISLVTNYSIHCNRYVTFPLYTPT